MKKISTLLSLVLFWGVATHYSAPAVVPNASARAVQKKAQLELTTSIIEQYSCAPDLLALHLRLTYTNTGKQPIILDKVSATIVDRYIVSLSTKDAAMKNYQQEVRAEDLGNNYGLDPKARPELSHFIIIGPGEAHSVDGPWTTASLVINNGEIQTKGGLVKGTYFLQVQVDTWSYLSDEKQLRSRWQDRGYLWSEPLTSVPQTFTIEGSRPLKKCI